MFAVITYRRSPILGRIRLTNICMYTAAAAAGV